jgi:hypothetical protein
MNIFVPSLPLHMKEQTEMCPLKPERRKQILCSNWNYAQFEQRISQLGMAAFVASG